MLFNLTPSALAEEQNTQAILDNLQNAIYISAEERKNIKAIYDSLEESVNIEEFITAIAQHPSLVNQLEKDNTSYFHSPLITKLLNEVNSPKFSSAKFPPIPKMERVLLKNLILSRYLSLLELDCPILKEINKVKNSLPALNSNKNSKLSLDYLGKKIKEIHILTNKMSNPLSNRAITFLLQEKNMHKANELAKTIDYSIAYLELAQVELTIPLRAHVNRLLDKINEYEENSKDVLPPFSSLQRSKQVSLLPLNSFESIERPPNFLSDYNLFSDDIKKNHETTLR